MHCFYIHNFIFLDRHYFSLVEIVNIIYENVGVGKQENCKLVKYKKLLFLLNIKDIKV